MPTINPYLTMPGTCEVAFNFYKSVFGGDFSHISRFGEMPGDAPVPESQKNKIMHVSLPLGNGIDLMGSDSSEVFGQVTVMGNSVSISVNTDDKAEARRIFDGLSSGGKVSMDLQETFWGALYGMLTDKFGINWMVNCDIRPEE
jgi:PhnB protein